MQMQQTSLQHVWRYKEKERRNAFPVRDNGVRYMLDRESEMVVIRHRCLFASAALRCSVFFKKASDHFVRSDAETAWTTGRGTG